MSNGKDDFNLDSVFDDDADLENIFGEKKKQEKPKQEKKLISEELDFNLDISDDDEGFTISEDIAEEKTAPPVKKADSKPEKSEPKKKRSFIDFEPDMDALLITAQSAMINEGMKLYTNKNFSASSLNTYTEAYKGIDLYIKILDRNPDNYHKLKLLIDRDIDCQDVERTAFSLYKRIYKELPETDRQKRNAFEMMQRLFREAVSKSSISYSISILKNYFQLSGTIDQEKVKHCIQTGDAKFKVLINKLNQQVKKAQDMSKSKNTEITKGMRGRDLNSFIIRATELLKFYYSVIGNSDVANYYDRINSIYKKYFIIRE